MIRVVFIDHVARMSGAEIALLRLCRALSAHEDVSVKVLLGESGRLVEELKCVDVDVEVVELDQRIRNLSRSDSWKVHRNVSDVLETIHYVLFLARKVRSEKPDVVHTFSLKSNILGGFAARLASVPQVWQANDHVSSRYLGRLQSRIVRSLGRILPNEVVANSESTLQTLKRSGVVLFPSLPDIGRFSRSLGSPRGTTGCVFGVVGRIARWKGHDVFLRAFARVLREVPAASAVIVGGPLFGEDDWLEELYTLARSLGIAGKISWLGHRDDIELTLSEMDVLVHCSVLPEPFGQVVVEGMAAGLPVIAADAGGPREIITNGEDGVLVEPGNVDMLALAMIGLIRDPERANLIADRAAVSARRFSGSVSARSHAELYRRVSGA